MVSRENRVLLASLVLAAVAVAVVVATPVDGSSAVVLLAVVPGLTILAPQLYLAATDDDVPSRTRVRVAVVLSVLYAMTVYASAAPDERLLVGAMIGALVVGLGGYEVVAGYRETTA